MENIIEQWVASARRHTNVNDLQVGVDISPYPQIKIAFDGYAEDDDEVEDLNMESYAVYIHKHAADQLALYFHRTTAHALGNSA